MVCRWSLRSPRVRPVTQRRCDSCSPNFGCRGWDRVDPAADLTPFEAARRTRPGRTALTCAHVGSPPSSRNRRVRSATARARSPAAGDPLPSMRRTTTTATLSNAPSTSSRTGAAQPPATTSTCSSTEEVSSSRESCSGCLTYETCPASAQELARVGQLGTSFLNASRQITEPSDGLTLTTKPPTRPAQDPVRRPHGPAASSRPHREHRGITHTEGIASPMGRGSVSGTSFTLSFAMK